MEQTIDRCQFGHELIPGSDRITLRSIDPATGRLLKEEKKLLRRHLVETGRSRFDPTGLVPATCAHGLKVRRDGNLTEKPGVFLLQNPDGAQRPRIGQSWIRSRYLRLEGFGKVFLVKCPICLGEEPPSDLCLPADGSFTPLPQDLPEWMQ